LGLRIVRVGNCGSCFLSRGRARAGKTSRWTATVYRNRVYR
jgi:hypothetical protein